MPPHQRPRHDTPAGGPALAPRPLTRTGPWVTAAAVVALLLLLPLRQPAAQQPLPQASPSAGGSAAGAQPSLSAGQVAGAVRGPWRQGELVTAVWRVDRVENHPEFLRYYLVRPGAKAAVELIADRQPPGPWTTGRHRLQPGPGSVADPLLLAELMPAVRQWDSRPAPPLQSRAPPSASQVAERSLGTLELGWRLIGWQLWLALWAALTALCWGRWLQRRDLPWLFAVAAGVGAVALWLRSWPVTTDWLHALHESQDIFPALTAHSDHDGPLPEALRALYPRHPQHWLALPSAAHAQLLAAATAGAGLALWAQRRLPGWAVVALLAGLATSPPLWRALLSELPAAWLLLLAWTALAPASLLAAPTGSQAPPQWQRLAQAQLWLTAAGLWLTRAELGLAAVVALLLWPRVRRGHLDDLVQRLVLALPRQPAWLLAAAAALLLPVGLISDRLAGAPRWILGALNPLHVSTWQLPHALLLGLSPGWLALQLVALVVAWQRAKAGRGAALLLAGGGLVVAKLYLTAAHAAPYEVQRYGSMLAPLVAVAAVLAAERVWRQGPRHQLPAASADLSHAAVARTGRALWASAALLASLALPPLPSLAALALPLPADHPAAWQPLDRDRQIEARFVLAVAATHPQCALVAKVVGPAGERSFVEHRRWTAASPLQPRAVQVPEAAGAEGALALIQPSGGKPAAPCTIELQLLDCYRIEGIGCPSPPVGTALVAEQRWLSRPYLAEREHGAFSRTIHLRAWLRRGSAPLQGPAGNRLTRGESAAAGSYPGESRSDSTPHVDARIQTP